MTKLVYVTVPEDGFDKVGEWFMEYIQASTAFITPINMAAIQVCEQTNDELGAGYFRGYQDAWEDIADELRNFLSETFGLPETIKDNA